MICNKLIPLDKPYQFTNRHDWVSAAISGAAALGSAILGATSTSASNRASANLNKTNRDWNEKMLDKENAWNLSQWNRENEYNSAAQQRARLEAAGLNPYLMLNGGSAGTAQSLSSASPGTASMSATPTPYDYSPLVNGAASAAQSLLQSRQLDQQDRLNQASIREANARAFNQEIYNKTAEVRNTWEIGNLINQGKDSAASAAFKQFQTEQGYAMLGGALQRQQIENQNLLQDRIESEARTTQIRYQAALSSAELSYLPQRVKSELALNAAQTYAARSAGLLNDKQAQLVVAQKNSEVLRQYGIRCSNYQQKYIASKLSWESNKAKADALHSWNNVGPDNTTQWHNKYSGKTRQNIYHGINTFSPLIPSVGIGFSR